MGKGSEAKQKGGLVKASLMKSKMPGFERTIRGRREGLRGMLKAQKEERSSVTDVDSVLKHLQFSWNAGSA